MSTRAVSPFIVFCNSKRGELAAAYPKTNFGEIGVKLAVLWKSMSDSERRAYAEPRNDVVASTACSSEPELRRSSRLRNKRLGLDFWGRKINK
jgi:hypothetical protein